MNNREMLLKRVQMHGFMAFEGQLFLDTHPTDKEALAFFKAHTAAMKQSAAEYEKLYGPLSAMDTTGDTWNWVDSPWPWENLGRYE